MRYDRNRNHFDPPSCPVCGRQLFTYQSSDREVWCSEDGIGFEFVDSGPYGDPIEGRWRRMSRDVEAEASAGATLPGDFCPWPRPAGFGARGPHADVLPGA